jgi:hypothetical protein
MKNYVKILFPALLCMTLCQTNVQGQIFKNALNKVKGALGGSAKSGVTNKAGLTKAEKLPSTGPAKPLAPDVKNPVSEMRSFTGLTKEELVAKMKSKGFVEGNNEMGQPVYKSKVGGYSLSVIYGTRGKASLVREVSKSDYHVKGGDAKIKTNFLGFGKQCTDLKTTYSSGYLVGPGAFGKKLNSNNPEQRTSKFLPAFDTFITNKEEGNAVEAYSETDYEYNINYFYKKGLDPVMVIYVIDNTVESLEG